MEKGKISTALVNPTDIQEKTMTSDELQGCC